MKILNFCLIILTILLSSATFAVAGDGEKAKLFTYDRQQILEVFEESDISEARVEINRSVKAVPFEFAGMNAFQTGMVGGIFSTCVVLTGPAAVLFVYLETDKNNEETKQALLGCLAGGGIGLAFWGLIFGAYVIFTLGSLGCCSAYFWI